MEKLIEEALTVDNLLAVAKMIQPPADTVKEITISTEDKDWIEHHIYRDEVTKYEALIYNTDGIRLRESKWIPRGLCVVEYISGEIRVRRLYSYE